MKQFAKRFLVVCIAAAMLFTVVLPAAGIDTVTTAQAATSSSSTYKETKDGSGVFTNGKYKYYLKKNAKGNYVLYRQTVKTGKKKKLKTFKKSGSASYAVTAVYGKNVYVTKSPKKSGKYVTYVYSTKKKKVIKTCKGVGITDTSEQYAVVTKKKAAGAKAVTYSIYKMTKKGLKKVKTLSSSCNYVTFVGKKVYYAVYPKNGRMNSVTIYRANCNGKSVEKLCSYKLSSKKKVIKVKKYTASWCKITYKKNGKTVTKKLVYETGSSGPSYAEQEEEFLAKDIEDFDGYTVINYDDDDTTNYAVLVKGAVTVEASDDADTPVSADDDSLTYVIGNASDLTTGLKAGDILYYIYGDGSEDYTLIKVDEILVSGDTVMVTGDTDASVSDFFTYVDVDMDVDVTEDYFTPSEDDSFAYEGSTTETVSVSTSAASEETLPVQTYLEYSGSKDLIKYNYIYTDGGTSLSVSAALTVSVHLRYDFEIWGENYIEAGLSVAPSFDVSGSVSANYSKDIKVKMGTISCPVGPTGLIVSGDLYFVAGVSCSGSVGFSCSLDAEASAEYDSDSGFTATAENNGFDLSVEAKAAISAKAGVELEAGLSFLKVVKVALSGSVALKASGEIDDSITYNTSEEDFTNDSLHSCALCIDGAADAVAELTGTCTVISKKLGSKSADYTYNLTDFYISLLNEDGSPDFGFGDCPNKVYRVTVTVTDADTGEAIAGASVYIDGTLEGTTDEDGVLKTWCANGSYTLLVKADDYGSGSTDFTVDGAAQEAAVSLKAGDDIPDEAVEYDGHYYIIYDEGYVWSEAEAYCENLGGHLVTITSQEEQDVVESLVAGGSRNSYWMGGYESSSGSWTWITGESFSYTNWASGQPDNYKDEAYLMMYKNENPKADSALGEWNDLDADGTCNGETFFGLDNFGLICEWE